MTDWYGDVAEAATPILTTLADHIVSFRPKDDDPRLVVARRGDLAFHALLGAADMDRLIAELQALRARMTGG